MPTMLIKLRLVALAVIAATPSVLHAQSAIHSPNESRADSTPSTSDGKDWRLTLTIFRSPGTGLQLSNGHFAVFVAHYPTVIRRDGEQRGTHFVRVGAAAYLAPQARTSPYASISFAPSLTKGWHNSLLGDVGVRQRFGDRYSGQLGGAVLYAPRSGETRINPTIGMGVHF